MKPTMYNWSILYRTDDDAGGNEDPIQVNVIATTLQGALQQLIEELDPVGGDTKLKWVEVDRVSEVLVNTYGLPRSGVHLSVDGLPGK